MTHPAARLVFAAQLLSTLAMFGIIWFVQVVHYPMFAEIVPSSFARYEAAYANRMGFLVGPLMLVELVSAGLPLFRPLRLPAVPAAEAWIGAALVGVIWASTAFVQIPMHNKLHAGYSLVTIRRLVASNWIRTAAWTARAGLLLLWVDRLGRGI